MNAENPVNAPTSRDPRLTHLRPPLRTSLSTLQAPQLPNSPALPRTANQNDVGFGDFIQGISGLVQATIHDTQNRAEKERLQKQKESTERLLKRARLHPNFPATIEYFQRARDDEDAEISRIKKALEDSTRHQLEKELKSKFPSSTTNEKIHELEHEVHATKHVSSQLRERNQTLETTLNAKLSELRERFESQWKTQAKHSRDFKERMDQYQALSSTSETTSAKIATEINHFKQKLTDLETTSAKLPAEMNNCKQKIMSLETRIEPLWKSQNHFTASVAKISEKTKEQEEKLDGLKLQDVESIRKGLFELKTHVLSYESSHAAGRQEQHLPHAELQELTSRLQKLESAPDPMPQVQLIHNGLKQLTEIRSKSDDLQFKELEEIKKKVELEADRSANMSNEIVRLANGMQNLSRQQNPAAQNVAQLAVSVQHTQKTLETVRIGLHSLETRYNNLTTETVVKNMVAAMQEMYPNISQLTDQTSRLKGLIDKELPPLLSRIDDIDQTLQSHMDTTRQDASARLEQLNRLKDDHLSLSQSLGPLWERFGSEDQQLVSSEEFRTLGADLGSLVNTISEYPAKDKILTPGDLEVLKSKFNVLDQKMSGFRTSFITQLGAKADDDRIRQTVNKERDCLSEQISSVSTQINELAKNFAEMKAADTNRGDKLASQEVDINGVRDRFDEFKESTLELYQYLCKELDNVRATMESHVSKASTPVTAQRETTKQESPAREAALVKAVAETIPGLALREQKRKNKRPRPSSLANEEKDSAPPSESPASFASPAPSTPRPDETPEAKRKKRRKKRKVEEPITIDD